MYTLFIVLIVLASIMMCFIVLIQESKGGGLASNFSSSNQIMGVRKTTDIIEKSTWGLAIAIVVFSVASSYTISQEANPDAKILNIENNTAPIQLPNSNASKTLPITPSSQGVTPNGSATKK